MGTELTASSLEIVYHYDFIARKEKEGAPVSPDALSVSHAQDNDSKLL